MAIQVAPRLAISRSRHSLIALLSALTLFLAAPSVRASETDPIEFMKQTARELIAAARSGSQRDFMEVIQNRGHISAIGLYALGNYKSQLRPADRETYYGGIVR
ncbi:MAG TPA: hypothetical protein VFX46_04895, partial [Hyphomicrobiaceae bacterium]|nr:hypothetical protein [Hyphomicrobiaceae bacterium]